MIDLNFIRDMASIVSKRADEIEAMESLSMFDLGTAERAASEIDAALRRLRSRITDVQAAKVRQFRLASGS